MPDASETLGFIGLGNIGGPMAMRMAEVSKAAIVYDAVPAAMTRFEGHAEIAANPAEVGRKATIVGICVRDDADVEAVVCGPDGLLEGMAPGGTILVHSTVGLDTIRRLNALAAEKGIDLLDAGVTGGAVRAAEGRLVTMIGGSDEAFKRGEKLAKTFSHVVVHGGPLGTGITLKICNNVLTYSMAMSANEAFGLVESAGISPDVLRQVFRGNGTWNEFLDVYTTSREGRGSLASFEHARKLAHKDLLHAMDLARETGWAAKGIAAVDELLPVFFADRK